MLPESATTPSLCLQSSLGLTWCFVFVCSSFFFSRSKQASGTGTFSVLFSDLGADFSLNGNRFAQSNDE